MPANDWSELGQCTFFMLSWSDGIEVYFQNLSEALERIPETNILNCGEANVTDDPYEKTALCWESLQELNRTFKTVTVRISYV